MLKRKLVIVAVAAALPTLASAQSPANTIGTAVNPDDSGYHVVVSENPYQAKAGARSAAAYSMLPPAVNPDDSGYHAVVTENPYQGKPAVSRTPLSSKFRVVFNPEDSGYLGALN